MLPGGGKGGCRTRKSQLQPDPWELWRTEEALEPVVPNNICISGWELVAVITAQDREGGGWGRKGTPASATIQVLCVEPFIPWGHCPATVDVVVVPWKGRWTDFLAPGPACPIGPVVGSRENVAVKGWCTHVCDHTKLQGQGPRHLRGSALTSRVPHGYWRNAWGSPAWDSKYHHHRLRAKC